VRVLVLGACGLQGRVAVYDLLRNPEVSEVCCVDIDPAGLDAVRHLLDGSRVGFSKMDASDPASLAALMARGFDVAIDLLPSRYLGVVTGAAVEAGCHLVNTMYGHQLPADLDSRAAARGVTIMPEAGLDPGIDLVLCAYGAGLLDEVHELHSWCGGIPEAGPAADNPLRYKISWSWEGVLWSYARPAAIIRDGEAVHIPAADQHAPQWVRGSCFPGFGELEVIPNGDALVFAEKMGVTGTLRNSTRCSYRWPGHSEFWHKLTALGFLEETPVPGLPGNVTPQDFLVRHLGPRLQYGPGERDAVIMRTIVGGIKDGRPLEITSELVDYRDLGTGFLAMNRTVGFAASIVAMMVARGEISARGVLTAVRDIPPQRFLDEIRRRGIEIRETRRQGP
jgi:saccharopine dehydrogenase-like NADP-dependent oxidoreductase